MVAIGAITLFAIGLLALVADDIKKVLAYSTVSQLGYMMTAVAAGGYTAGLFHLFTHAFFKALLFLGAGSVIHAVHSNNMSDMGGLRKHMPRTYLDIHHRLRRPGRDLPPGWVLVEGRDPGDLGPRGLHRRDVDRHHRRLRHRLLHDPDVSPSPSSAHTKVMPIPTSHPGS